jgi:DNA-binding transcriptional regulator YhcF (GntR family)
MIPDALSSAAKSSFSAQPAPLARRLSSSFGEGEARVGFRRIAAAVRWEIGMGRCQVGESLPAIRALAAELGVNYHTVRRAYELLETEGVLAARRGAGTIVLRRPVESRRARTITVIECNLTEAEELARDITATCALVAQPWLLHSAVEPPAGVIVGTRFHAEAIRRRWPHRSGDLVLVDRDPDPRLRDVLRDAVALTRTRRLVLVEQDRETGRRMAAELRPLLAPLGLPLRVGTARWPERVPDRLPKSLILFAPRVWDALPWIVRAHPRARLARFRAVPDSLAGLARQIGWPVHTHPRES